MIAHRRDAAGQQREIRYTMSKIGSGMPRSHAIAKPDLVPVEAMSHRVCSTRAVDTSAV